MRFSLARLLRSLATWIDGGESDADLRARMLNTVRRRAMRGSVGDLEIMIAECVPAGLLPTFSWSPDRRTMTMRLM